MTSGPKTHRDYGFISNRAFTQMTGIRKVCFGCGAADPPPSEAYPGKRPEAAR